ncbi:hypothetical protein J3E69DRAFT_269301 [Trichoderma sp. SZMC 28015]
MKIGQNFRTWQPVGECRIESPKEIIFTGHKMRHKKKSLNGSSTSDSGENTHKKFSCDSRDNVDLPLTQEINENATFHHITMQSQAHTYQACTAPSSNGIPLVPPLAPVVTTAYSIFKTNYVSNIQQGR